MPGPGTFPLKSSLRSLLLLSDPVHLSAPCDGGPGFFIRQETVSLLNMKGNTCQLGPGPGGWGVGFPRKAEGVVGVLRVHCVTLGM